MASRAHQKQEARRERERRAIEQQARELRARRLRMLAGVLAAAALLVIVAIAVSTSGDDSGPSAGGPVEGAADVQRLFAGVPQNGLALGRPDAPVTLVEYADLQCPFCRDAAVGSLPTVVEDYVKTGHVRIEFRNFPVLGPDSEKAARALDAAAAQDRAWQFIELWYRNQGEENSGYVTDGFIQMIAGAVPGLDAERVVDAANAQTPSPSVAAAVAEAQRNGVDSTPTFLIGRTGRPPQRLDLSDPSDPAAFKKAIDAALPQK